MATLLEERRDGARARLLAEVRDVLESTTRHTAGSADVGRRDRLWAADPRVLLTNPLSVAYGACGTMLFLNTVAGPLPERLVRWLLDQPLSTRSYPPGLFLGLGGIAWTLRELGCDEAADRALAVLYRSPLLFEEPHLLHGASGWGLVAIDQFRRTGDEEHLAWALRAGRYLQHTAWHDGDSAHWRSAGEEKVHFGFGFGASGVALFLLQLHAVTGDAEFAELAVRALDFDVAHRVENELGWNWQRYEGDALIRPYWIEGGAGIGSVAIRAHHLLGSARHLAVAERIAQDLCLKFTVTPGLFEGLTGIAEFMLDMHRFTGEQAYLDQALDMAETILWFRVPAEGGTAWPGRSLDRITHDYATGAAGIGLFLARLCQPGPRLFLDIEGEGKGERR
ncbi:lanthionine synthetase C family protein [Nonomuraea sediminis]|uniref:lanthionine synthetase C family protein n=1 Tax=Nonomuraea sediminis TaxID=2835864 RepID=UPI001BDD2AFE|nr:lanthionine synthetase C family protein [Nonomuraea sediminis]